MIRLQIIMLHYNINRKAGEIFALSSGKIDIYECLTGKETLSPEEKTQTIQVQEERQTKVIEKHSKQPTNTNKSADKKITFCFRRKK